MHVAALRSALVADGSELKRSYAIGDSFRALHLKLSPAYPPPHHSVLNHPQQAHPTPTQLAPKSAGAPLGGPGRGESGGPLPPIARGVQRTRRRRLGTATAAMASSPACCDCDTCVALFRTWPASTRTTSTKWTTTTTTDTRDREWTRMSLTGTCLFQKSDLCLFRKLT